MKVVLSSDAWADVVHWLGADVALLRRVCELIEDARRHPFVGLGKPEPLRGELRGFWSRRITAEHRLIYRVRGSGEEQMIEVAACRYHYR